MIKKLAWNTFKNTGDINSYLELVEVENIEKNIANNINKVETKEIKNNVKEDLN